MVAKTTENPQREELKQKFVDRLQLECSVSPDEASDKQIYQVLSALMVEKLKHKRQHFINKTNSVGGKNVYYLSMEFLMGRSLKTTLYNPAGLSHQPGQHFRVRTGRWSGQRRSGSSGSMLSGRNGNTGNPCNRSLDLL